MKRTALIFSSALALILASGLPIPAQTTVSTTPQVPRLIKFGGTIENAKGVQHVIFRLYKDQMGGNPLWEEGQQVSFDEKGIYSILLGSGHEAGLPSEVFTSSEARWLGVQVDGQPEEKRILLVSVPYALKAGDAETIGGKPLSSFVLAGDTTGVGSDGLTYVNTKNASAFVASVSKNGVTKTAAPTPLASTGSLNYVAKFDALGNVLNSSIFDNGKIGIGTTTPARTLDVGASGQIGFGSNGISTTLSTGLFWYSDSRFGIYKTAGAWTAPNYQNLMISWPAGVVIDGGSSKGYGKSGTILQPSGGRVGINTSTPTSPLTVAGVIESTSGGFKFPDGTTLTSAVVANTTGEFIVDYSGTNAGTLTTGALRFGGSGSGEGIASQRSGGNESGLDFYAGWNARMSITNSGNVGIGTTAPNTKLDVRGNIVASGYVGIGTTSPSCALDVNGDISANGTVTAGPGRTKTPFAYASFGVGGAKLSGSSNLTCGLYSANPTDFFYVITIADETYNASSFVVTATASTTNEPLICSTNVFGNNLAVRIWNVKSPTYPTVSPFHIVICKP